MERKSAFRIVTNDANPDSHHHGRVNYANDNEEAVSEKHQFYSAYVNGFCKVPGSVELRE